eukprot:8545334-Lingulodinium_polyedra.AAC.1
MAWHTKWVTLSRAGPTDEATTLHETLCRTLQVLACYDQCDLGNLAAAEILCRQLQLVEERQRESGSQKGDQGKHAAASTLDGHLYLGSTASRGGLCICPQLD